MIAHANPTTGLRPNCDEQVKAANNVKPAKKTKSESVGGGGEIEEEEIELTSFS